MGTYKQSIYLPLTLLLFTFLDQSGTRSSKSLDNNMNKDEELVISDVKLFTYDELKLATRDFRYDTCMGEGTYEKSYKGWVDKTTYSPFSKADQYDMPSKLEILKEFQHPNLVKFIGYCLESGYIFLVYEFMLKGNFDDLLRSGSVARLPLATRVKIVVGIARGIVFLQKQQLNKTWPNVRDSILDRRKILLDEDFTAKLSDYDVAFLVNGQYDLASRECDGLELALKSDLSGYEVVFLEVLTGERIYYLNEVLKIDRLFRECGKESSRHIAQLCFEMCNEVDVESKMLTMLKEHAKLIRRRLKSWLSDPYN
ncbi:hypothetical protein QVD17_27597 [Tagetes erecta]|uniref:Protein kinase domain-containing protein n=1 Tax=Tagetes erecta TaxID=13708 RepID=A0AAD8KDH4_TARER|nr:hypothetical protein QVD17_27597 [Tagetes erecta]